MLVLTRRAGESVMIGNDVIITVLEARGDVIRLGIQAPRDVQVHREEVFRELQFDFGIGQTVAIGSDEAQIVVLGSMQITNGAIVPWGIWDDTELNLVDYVSQFFRWQ